MNSIEGSILVIMDLLNTLLEGILQGCFKLCLHSFREEKSPESSPSFSALNGSTLPNPSDSDRDAKLREIVSHIYQYVSRQYNIRQMTQQQQQQQPGVSLDFRLL